MKHLEAKPMRHTDYSGKEKYYVQISNGEKTHFIVSGKGTIEELEKMMEDSVKQEENTNQTKLPLEDVVKQENEKEPNGKQEKADALKVDKQQGTRR